MAGHQVPLDYVCRSYKKCLQFSIHLVKDSIFGVSSSVLSAEDVRGVARAGEIIKPAVIDGILMEEDGSISNISRF